MKLSPSNFVSLAVSIWARWLDERIFFANTNASDIGRPRRGNCLGKDISRYNKGPFATKKVMKVPYPWLFRSNWPPAPLELLAESLTCVN
jgi:hypothetical protein